MSWDAFAESVSERRNSRSPRTSTSCTASASYATLRRYAPEFLAVLKSCGPRPPLGTCWMPSRCCAA